MYRPAKRLTISNTSQGSVQLPPSATPLPNWEELNAHAEATLQKEREKALQAKTCGKKTGGRGRGSRGRGALTGASSHPQGEDLLRSTSSPAGNSSPSTTQTNDPGSLAVSQTHINTLQENLLQLPPVDMQLL
jgi:hypothetical protein